MANSSIRRPVERKRRRLRTKGAAQPVKTIELSLNGRTIKGRQAAVPTGIFPVPDFIRHWAGLS